MDADEKNNISGSNKRKHDVMHNHGGGGDETMQPDAVASSSSTPPEDHLDDCVLVTIPDDNTFPTLDQLEDWLSFLLGLTTTGNDHDWRRRRGMAVKVLRAMEECANSKSEDGEDMARQKTAFKKLFLAVSGPLRMVLFIKKNMEDTRLVSLSSSVAEKCMNVYLLRDGHDEFLRMLTRASSKNILDSKGLQVLQLALEETPRNKTARHWRAAEFLWRFTAQIIRHRPSWKDIPADIMSGIVEADIRYFQDPIDQNALKYAVCAIDQLAHTLVMILSSGSEAMGAVCKQSDKYRIIREFIEAHETRLPAKKMLAGIFYLGAVGLRFDAVTREETLKWIPFVGNVLSSHFSNADIEDKGFRFVLHVVERIGRRQLDKTPLVSSLMKIVQSDDAPERLKAKYRWLIAGILA